ncbi:MAG: alpha/beta hydrolase [Bacteroidota bacterium]|nr:alpha/beta hydrolase [Bacteroidota bacterium]
MLKYFCQGSGGQTLVLIHGYCENNTCFNKQVLFFKDSHKVITLDLPGFGSSEVITDVSMDQMATEVKAVLDHLDIRQCIMMGHSMGGYVVMAFAELYPQMLTSFGLIHSVATADNEERKEKRKQVIALLEKTGKEPYIKSFIPTLFATPNQSEPYVNDFILQGLSGPKEGIIEAAKAMMNRPDRLHVLEQTQVPVFFAIGKQDPLIPEEAMFKQAALCKVSQICYLQNAGHVGMVEEPDMLNKGMMEFINSRSF